MRTIMNEEKIKEAKRQNLSERSLLVEQLNDKWQEHPEIGPALAQIDESKKENLLIDLQNQWNYLKESNTAQSLGTTPENMLRLVMLTSPNLVVDDIFSGKSLTSTRDALYYLDAVYESPRAGVTDTAGNAIGDGDLMNSRNAWEPGTPTNKIAPVAIADGVEDTGTLAANIKPFFVKVVIDGALVGQDDGAGNIVGENITGTVDYATGAYAVTTSGFGGSMVIFYNWNHELRSNINNITNVRAKLRAHYFNVDAMPLGLSWSKLADAALGTTTGEKLDERLLAFAAAELVKTRNLQAIDLAHQVAQGNGYGIESSFKAHNTRSGADSYIDNAQVVLNEIDNLGDKIYNKIRRGGVSKIIAGSEAANYLKLHNNFTSAGAGAKKGVHKIGVLDGRDVYKAPSDSIPTNRIIGVWKDPEVVDDVALGIGTLIPFYATPVISYKTMESEMGVAHFGAQDVLNQDLIVAMDIDFTPV
jgi:hypothetical protein